MLCNQCQDILDGGGAVLIFTDGTSIGIIEITKEMHDIWNWESRVYFDVPKEIMRDLFE